MYAVFNSFDYMHCPLLYYNLNGGTDENWECSLYTFM